MKIKKIPERTCIGCQQIRPKMQMIRIVRSPEGEISVDKTGKKSGRGAYICPEIECFQMAEKSRRLERAFSCKIENSVYRELEDELKNT